MKPRNGLTLIERISDLANTFNLIGNRSIVSCRDEERGYFSRPIGTPQTFKISPITHLIIQFYVQHLDAVTADLHSLERLGDEPRFVLLHGKVVWEGLPVLVTPPDLVGGFSAEQHE